MSSILALRYFRRYLKCAPSSGNILTINQNQPAARSINTKYESSRTSTGTNNDEWRIIYRLPMIHFAAAFNGVKVSYGIVNSITIPAVYALEQASQLPPTTALLISSVGITSWCTLAICSFFIQNLIGMIYINDTNDKLKFAYVDYWGKRHDVCVKLDDVVPENDKPNPSKVDFYQSLCLYSDDKVKYKLLQRYGRIEDPATFSSIFGD